MLFSLRHKGSLRSGKFKPSFAPRALRRSVVRVLQEFATPQYDRWNDVSSWAEFEAAEAAVLKETGQPQLGYRDNDGWKRADFEGVVIFGYPTDALDLIEACLAAMQSKSEAVQRAVNDTLKAHRSQWRIVNGELALVDSEYLNEEVVEGASHLLGASGFEGPLREFSDAVNALTDGNNRDAVVAANNALESTIKALLSIQRERPGRLIRKLIDSKLIPAHFEGFLDALERILVTVLVERSEPGRAHGSGADAKEIPDSLARFTVHLVGSLIVFLLRQDRVASQLAEGAAAVRQPADEEPPPLGDEDAPPPLEEEEPETIPEP